MDIQQTSPYLRYSGGGHEVVAAFSDAVKGETAVFFDGNWLDALPTDYVLGFHIHNEDLYIVYNRSIRRIANIDGGNTNPEEGYTLEMQDYYSYEPPQMLTGTDGTLWAHIGGRLFRRDGNGWTEVAAFPIGESAMVTEEGLLQFSKNLLRDDVTDGCRIFNPKTGQLIET